MPAVPGENHCPMIAWRDVSGVKIHRRGAPHSPSRLPKKGDATAARPRFCFVWQAVPPRGRSSA
jgi:hypothetical protein